MAFFFEEKDRLVLPNWRSFSNTAKMGELNGSHKLLIEKSFSPDISDIVDGWLENKTIGMAADLIGVAIICNKQDDENVKEAASFILSNSIFSSSELIEAANAILKVDYNKVKPILDSNNLEAFQERSNMFFVYNKISELKVKLRSNPKNPILWVEIARYYSIIGQNKQAERSILNAYRLSPQNRFILRSMARFFTHIGKTDYIHDIIRKSDVTKFDPWIMSAEISLASKRGRYSRFMKSGLNLVSSNNFHPFNISELNSSLGTIELESSLKKSRHLFKDSLLYPNDNTLAQAEWISHKERKLFDINPADFNVHNDFEAKARDSSEHGKWEDSIDYAKLWFLDMPFSRGAILFGSEIASNNLENHSEAVSLYKAGLTSHPNDKQMLNNIVYSLCLSNRLDEADQYIERYKNQHSGANIHHDICYTATKGLYHFRKGYHDIGRTLYMEAITKAADAKEQRLANIAFVNLIREEVMSGNEIEEGFKEKVLELKNKSDSLTVQKIITQIESLTSL
ncbi:MAG: Tfp pilus assembly protein PilF [Planctomycetota bacterium]|jgi:Tfp pilus assembly protein PilF